MIQSVAVPYPPSILSPNARAHWRPLAAAKKKYKHLCMSECMAAGLRKMTGPLKVTVEMSYPDKRARDDDNAFGSFKSGRDGIAEYIRVDDALWKTKYSIINGKPGTVVVTLEEAGCNT